MASDLQSVAKLLTASLDPGQHKQAETALRQAEKEPGYSLVLLQIVSLESYPVTTRLASSLYFKNFIRRNWTDEEGNYKLPEDEVVAIKRELIGLMTSVPPAIQTQLGEAISVIADSDFWERWDTLVNDLVARLSPNNPVVNNGVLQVAHSIFKRWRPLFRSDELYTEINHVLSKFSMPFLTLLVDTDKAIAENENNPEKLRQYFQTLNLILKLFFDLSCQDLPPVFEENFGSFAVYFHKYLTYNQPVLQTSDDSESGILEYVKSGILESLILFTQTYNEVIRPFLGQFMSSTWNLVTTLSLDPKYDILVSRALKFLNAVLRIPEHAEAFGNKQFHVFVSHRLTGRTRTKN